MTDRTAGSPAPVARAQCAGCRRSYRVPDPERIYTCKACGGEVRCAPQGLLADADPDAHASASEVASRRNASSELKAGYRWMSAITWLYRLGAVSYGIVTAVAVVALMSLEVPLRPGLLVVALCTVLTVTMLMGAIQLLFEPFVWTLVIAILATMVAAVHWVGPNPLGLAFFFSAGWALLFWAAVVPTWRFKRLISEHTDLYVTHHASHATRRSLVGRSPRERHERLVRAMRRAFGRAIKVSSLAAVLLVAASATGAWFTSSRLRPFPVEEAVAAFEQAWNENRPAQVAALFQPHARGARGDWLTGMARAHGWGAGLPSASVRSLWDDAEDTRWIEYNLEGGLLLTAQFVPSGRRWALGRLQLPDPPIDPFVERLVAAWKASDARALVELFPPGHADQMLPSIQNSLDLRSWVAFPPILDTRPGEAREGAVDVALALADGDVVARCLLDGEGRWHLNALRFPDL